MRIKRQNKKIKTPIGLILLCIIIGFGLFLLILSSMMSGMTLPQGIAFIVSMIILWYASHPLSHFVSAKLYRVNVLYFYIGKSEIGKIDNAVAKLGARLFVTIGTKLDKTKLSLLDSNASRAIIFGSGSIVSTVVLALILLYAFAARIQFALPSLALGTIFFIASLATEILISTKVGDLAKMKRELAK